MTSSLLLALLTALPLRAQKTVQERRWCDTYASTQRHKQRQSRVPVQLKYRDNSELRGRKHAPELRLRKGTPTLENRLEDRLSTASVCSSAAGTSQLIIHLLALRRAPGGITRSRPRRCDKENRASGKRRGWGAARRLGFSARTQHKNQNEP
ncbi:hypothetical protein BESB_054750 [Besnoitia besnoiti]|uniref:Secreted protein n=1 Tax=Besnoitia besnoiti TaxID=94643 RepID=A0A2A9MF45_BESBE|nr:hypothetical protein BESB_054750 [Besnoitia besnoiti]PFH35824.1 hypothetical protein BESB_054750 [Besnoitia besnoiti]